ncbi:MAG: cyclic nucleotide-binding domain-containing protein [Verrucomicrobiae bacterium]|nr:cyclic nucleotide-binding domain-containing protein [Verrucomicrobiae bacterium]
MTTLLEFCAGKPVESFGPDEVIIGENHKDGKLRILKRGVVEIAKRGTIVNRLSSPGSVLGEIAILLDQSFGATVTTLEDTEVYVIEEGDRFLQENPDFMALVAKLIAKRLRNLTDELVEIREQVEAQREDGNDMEQFDGVLQRLIDHHLDREY